MVEAWRVAVIVDGPIWSKSEIRDLWLRSGGSALYADIASAVALATSGGRPSYVAQQADGTVNRGLWGINSAAGMSSTNDPVANARGAIQQSNNGTDWRTWPAAYDPTGYLGPTSPVRALASSGEPLGQYPTAGNRPTATVTQSAQSAGLGGSLVNVNVDILSSLVKFFGIPTAFVTAYLRYALYILTGSAMILIGFILMFVSLRQVKNVGSFVLETGAAGVGFGAGAAVLSGDRRKMRGALRPPGGSAGVRRTVRPVKPSGGGVSTGRHSTGTSVQETLIRARHREPVSEGGKGLGSPVVAPKPKRRKTRNASVGLSTRERRSPLTGNKLAD